MSHTGSKKAEMNQISENCVRYEARHKQKQAPHLTESIIDAISWNWPRIGWMAVMIIMIKTVTKTKANATKPSKNRKRNKMERKRKKMPANSNGCLTLWKLYTHISV